LRFLGLDWRHIIAHDVKSKNPAELILLTPDAIDQSQRQLIISLIKEILPGYLKDPVSACLRTGDVEMLK